MLLRKDLIRVNVDYDSREEALRSFAEEYVKAGVVKDTYPQAILDREKVYPTGLPAIAFDIAIPHCDSQYVNEAAIGVCTLAHPIEFNQMGGGEPIHPVMLFMLAIKDPDAQISTLRKIMGVIQNKDLLEKIRQAKTEDEIYDLLAPELDK